MYNKYSVYNFILHEFDHINILDNPQYKDTIMGIGVIYDSHRDVFLSETKFDLLMLDDRNGIMYKYTTLHLSSIKQRVHR